MTINTILWPRSSSKNLRDNLLSAPHSNSCGTQGLRCAAVQKTLPSTTTTTQRHQRCTPAAAGPPDLDWNSDLERCWIFGGEKVAIISVEDISGEDSDVGGRQGGREEGNERERSGTFGR